MRIALRLWIIFFLFTVAQDDFSAEEKKAVS